MTRGMVKGARGRVAAVAMCLLLAAGGLAALPAVPAGASTTVVAVFSGDVCYYATPLCSLLVTYHYGGKALEVFNPCSDRVWVHYISGSTVQEYCVNPGGGLAYDLPINWAGGDISDLQITTNKSPCDAGADFEAYWLACAGGCIPLPSPFGCQMNHPPITATGLWVYEVGIDGCNFRIWLHEHDDGSGNSVCIDPGPHDVVGYYPAGAYWQVQETDNQAPCSAGGP